MLTHARSGSHWARLGRRAEERRARVREPAAGVAGEEPAIGERLELRQGSAIEDRRRRNAEHGCPFDDLRNLVLLGPPVDDGAQLRLVGDAGAGAVELGVVDEIRAVDHRQEVVPLLRGEGRQPDKAVLAGFDARNHFDRRPPADAPGNRSGHRWVAHERHRDASRVDTSTSSPPPVRWRRARAARAPAAP